ncbi:MAG: VWA domain-containing protein [Candidatus Hodarchaeota archaeon]
MKVKNKSSAIIIYSVLIIAFFPILLVSSRMNSQISNESIMVGGLKPSSADASAGYAIMLTLDISGSMTPQDIADSKEAAHLLLEMLDEDTHVGLVTYGPVSLNVPLGRKGNATHYQLMKAQIDAMVFTGPTPTYWALNESLQQFNSTVYSSFLSKHILLMTDGLQNPAGPLDEIKNSCIDMGIRIHGMAFGSFDSIFVKNLCEPTGGLFFNTTEVVTLAMAYAEVASIVDFWENRILYPDSIAENTSYFVGYYPVYRPHVRMYLFWNHTTWNLTLTVRAPNNTILSSMNSSGSGARPAWLHLDAEGLSSVKIYVESTTLASGSIDYGLIIDSKEFPATPPGSPFPVDLVVLIISISIGAIGILGGVVIARKKRS